MAEGRRTVVVSGTTYLGALDPLATEWERGEGPPPVRSRKVGKGRQYVYELTPAELERMLERLESLAEGFAQSDQPETRAEGRAFARDAAKLRAQLA